MSSRSPTRQLVLASASPARLRLLRDAGLDPQVVVSHVDESPDGLVEPRALVQALAVRKAEAVAAGLSGPLVLGCDSLLDIDGTALGKPGSPAEATDRWRQMRGRTGTLVTGHCLLDTRTGGRVDGVSGTTVRFGRPTDDEIEAYVATGEPLQVAGAFTLDGRSAPFVDSVDGDPGTVIGLSLPLLRTLLERLGVRLVDLWS